MSALPTEGDLHGPDHSRPALAAVFGAPAGPVARRLVASYCFPPYSDTAAIVAAKRVHDHGEAVDVICNAMDSIRHRDPSLVQLCGGLVRRFAAVPSRTAFSSWTSISSYAHLGLDTFLRWEAEQGEYESVYSRAQFAASHFLAAQVKTARPQISWDAEFSDPLSHDVLGRPREARAEDDRTLARLRESIEAAGFRPPDGLNSFEWCEALAFALADRIMFTNEHQRDFMLESCRDPQLATRAERVSVVSPHPTPAPELYTARPSEQWLDPDRRHIGYFGNFYANRGVAGVLDALDRLPRAHRDRVLLHVYTSKPEELREVVADRGLADCVDVGPFVGYLDFLALARRMDCLLVNDAVSPPGVQNPFLPSKWSDYRGSGTPVWGVVEEGSALDGQPLDHRSPIEHVSAAVQVLMRISSAPARSGAVASPTPGR
jgi:glycosyltransferase involved in cell wall biosynthesis